MRFCVTLLLAAAAVVASASAARACTCVGTPPVSRALEQSAAVFSGRAVKVRRVRPDPGPGGFDVEVVFAVSRSWKGVESPTVSVFTSSQSSMCGYAFRTGRTYLVYAHAAEGGPLSTGICGRTRRLKDAREDLRELGAGRPAR